MLWAIVAYHKKQSNVVACSFFGKMSSPPLRYINPRKCLPLLLPHSTNSFYFKPKRLHRGLMWDFLSFSKAAMASCMFCCGVISSNIWTHRILLKSNRQGNMSLCASVETLTHKYHGAAPSKMQLPFCLCFLPLIQCQGRLLKRIYDMVMFAWKIATREKHPTMGEDMSKDPSAA